MVTNPIYPDRWAVSPRQNGWPNMRFSIVLEMTSKQLIDAVTVMSYYGDGDATQFKQLTHRPGPFDDISGLIQDLITETAVQQFEQIDLDFGKD